MRTKSAGIDLIAYPTEVKDVVTIVGSLPAGDAFAGSGNAAVPTLVGMMLERGTKSEDQFKIAQQLEDVGADAVFAPEAGAMYPPPLTESQTEAQPATPAPAPSGRALR